MLAAQVLLDAERGIRCLGITSSYGHPSQEADTPVTDLDCL